MSATFDPTGSQPLPATSNNSLPPGSVVGDFTIQGLVGEGGFGVVYRAFDNGMQREVALKEYMPNALARRRADGQVELRAPQYESTFAAGRKSFVNEAKLLAQFDHTALVKVLRFFEANGTAYMVMPLYHGRTLKQLLRESPGVDEAWIKSMLAPLLDALETLHGARCFHRDVAPDNILILDSGGPLLLDFGAARRIIGDMTQAVTVVIKPGYAPVEQYADDNSLQQGPWTDIYALAAVVRLAITGKPPATSVTRMVTDPVKPLADVAQGYSPAFLRAIDYGLAVRPEDRPQSIAEFRQVLGLGSPAARPVPAAPAAPSPAAPQPRPPPPAPTAAAPIPAAPIPAAAPRPAAPPASAPPPQPSVAATPPFATQRVAAPPPTVAPPTQPSGAAPPPSATQRVAAPPPFGTQKVAAAPPLAAEPASPVGETIPMRSHQTVLTSPAQVTASTKASIQSRPPASPPPRPQWLPIAIVVAMMVVVVGAGYLVMQAVTSPPARETVARAPVPSPSPVTPPAAPAPKAAPPAPAPAPPPAAPLPQAEPPQATTPPPQASPPPPQASPPPMASPTAPPPSATPAPAPTPETRPQPSAPPATAPAPTPPPAATPAAPVPAQPPVVPAPTGRVMLDIKPWGEVVVDGRARGLSPPLKVLQLPEGAHRIEVRNPAGAALVRDVKVTAGGRVEVSHTFR